MVATRAIPIVMPAVADPVGEGLVASLARPGGNVTGVTLMSPDLSAKRLQLLKEAFPRIVRVAVLYNPTDGGVAADLQATAHAARALGLTLFRVEVREPQEFERAFALIAQDKANALLTLSHTFTLVHRGQIVELAAQSRLPAMYGQQEFVEAGGLMSYHADKLEMFRRTAFLVDKILKGTKPADLPVEQPTKFELLINLKTAKTRGPMIPPSVLLRADRVIE